MSRKNSEETRTRILNATWKLLNAEGSDARMADVAKEAGVSRQAVYLHFPSRAELFVATANHIDEVEDVAGQIAAVLQAETGREKLDVFVEAWGNYIPVIYGGAKGLLDLKDTDADAETAWKDRMAGLYSVCEVIVETLAGENQLAEGLTKAEAADVLWSTLSVRQWELLTLDRKIKQKRYVELIQRTLLRTLVSQ